MNPNFALDFRNDQIKLLHLQEGVWVQIGVVAVDDPDLDAALGYLRSTALGLSPRGLASQLILPDAAILYTTLSNLSPDATTRAAQIALALKGRTPYDVADLVYDWVDDGSQAHLAVIARETLDEAEAFANLHRFNPVAFAGWPEQGQFPTEANFGRSAPVAEVVVPMQSPVPTALSASDFEMGDAAVDDTALEDAGVDEVGVDEVGSGDITQDQAAVNDLEPMPVLPSDDLPNDHLTFAPADQDGQSDLTAAMIDPDVGPDDGPAVKDAPLREAADPVSADFEQADGQVTAPSGDPKGDPEKPERTLPVQPDLFAPAPSFAAIMAEETEEAPMALDVPVDENASDAPDAGPVMDPIASPSSGKAQTLLAEFAARREAALGKADSAGRVEPKLSADKIAAPSAPAVIRAEAAPRLAVTAPQKTLRTSDGSLGSKPSVKRPAEKARGSRSALMGFVLTILLLIALAAAAALSSYLTTAWNSYGASTALALSKAGTADVQALATRRPQPSIPDQSPADPSPLVPNVAAQTTAAPDSPAPQTAELAVPAALPVPVTGPVPSLGSASLGSASLGSASVGSASAGSANLGSESTNTLLPLATPAALPAPIVVAPPNIETASAVQMITPTAQGVLTPEGVFLIAGRPSVLPNARPATVVAAALQRPDTATPDSAIFANPALAGKKPSLRPAGLAPQITASVIQNDPALAEKRPLLRPETVLAAANSAQIALASLAQSEVDAPRSAMAVTISRLPAARPRNLDTTTAAPPVLAAPEQIIPEAITPEVVASNVPLEADNEPEVVNPKSTGPRTVVSQNATFKNAINLSKVNLIGVYGSQAKRYALIRQSNGRFKKVYVGDRFDGGLVSAITESELRYSKNGQMLALQMPNG